MRNGHIFKLVDGTGREILLEEDPLLYNVTGVGIAFGGSFANISDGFFGNTDRTMQQSAISGTLAFRSTSYRDFLKFCDTDLKIGYLPYGDTQWYFSSCKLKTLSKTDLDRHLNVLLCDVEFELLSPWALENPSQHSISPVDESLTYPRTYSYTYGTDAAGTVEFVINGDLDGAYTLDIGGALTSPVITLYKQNGRGWTEIGKAEINENFTSSQKLRMSVRPDDPYIEKVSGDIVTDITDKISITNNAFARPPRGRCKLKLESSSTVSTIATVRIYDYFLGV